MAYTNPYDTLKTGKPDAIFNFPNTSTTLDPSKTLPGQATQQNLSAGPDLSSLTDMVNKLNIGGQTAANQARIPGAAGLEATSSANIGQELAGQLSPDVINLLQQQGAERGVGMGSPGSDNSNAAYLRALGLTSLQQQQLGQQNLSQAYARNPGAQVFNPASQFITPAQLGDQQYKSGLLSLDWWNALHGQPTRGGGGGSPFAQPTSGGSSWFPTAGGTPAMPNSPISSGGGGFVNDPNYPGTSMAGFPGLTSIIGTPDPGYGLSPDPFGQAPPTDFSNPGAWDFTGGGGEDPFLQLQG